MVPNMFCFRSSGKNLDEVAGEMLFKHGHLSFRCGSRLRRLGRPQGTENMGSPKVDSAARSCVGAVHLANLGGRLDLRQQVLPTLGLHLQMCVKAKTKIDGLRPGHEN